MEAQELAVAVMGCVSMNSIEIAKLTGKDHTTVAKDAREVITELYGEESVSKFSSVVKGEEVFTLSKHEVLVLLMGYSIEISAAIIDRWLQLEKDVRSPIKSVKNSRSKRARLEA